MEKRVNFIILGVFIIGLFVAIVGTVLWLSDYGKDKSYKYYLVNTKDSVSGLNIQAPVKFRGVEVGQVSNIAINMHNSEEVSITIKVKPSTPIKEDTYAIIEPQGITGLSFLQLEGGSNTSKLLSTSEDDMAVIKSKASIFSQVNTTFRSIAQKLEATLTSINSLINEKNSKNVSIILENTAKASKTLADITDTIDGQKKVIESIIKNAQKVEIAAVNSVKKMGEMSQTINTAVQNGGIDMIEKISVAADSVKSLMDKTSGKLNDGLLDVKGATKGLIGPLNQTLNELDVLLNRTGKFVEQLKQSPSDILYKYSTQKPGPGEKQ